MPSRAVAPMAPGSTAAGDELYRRLQLSLLLRVIMVTFLLGATVFIHFTRTPSFLTLPLIALYLLSGITYLITLLSTIALRWLRRLSVLAYLHILWEVVFVTALIWISGGIESIFSFLYLLAIIVGGILLYQPGAFLAALAAALFYGAVIAGMEAAVIPSLLRHAYDPVGWTEIIYNFFINLSAMFGMAVLSTYLTAKLRATGDELKETIRDRQALEALNDNIVRSITSGLISLDLKGRITSFNAAAQAITGLAEPAVLGQEFNVLFPGMEIPDPAPARKDALRRELAWQYARGETRFLEFRASPLFGAGQERQGALVLFNDITEMRSMEDRLRKADRLAAVGQLAAGMAHEIRNPLASISGAVQVLGHETVEDSTRGRLVSIVVRETDRLNSLITDFLLFARPSPRAIQPVRLDYLIPEIIEAYRHRSDLPPQTGWNLEIAPGLEMETDPKLLEQILWNLVNNAVQAMPDGGRLTIRARREEKLEPDFPDPGSRPQPSIWIEVEDEGSGIPRQHLERIFDPFFTTRENGTGLGLSMVYRIVEAMDGEIAVEDGRSRGARFIIRLPRKSPSPADGDRESEVRPTAGGGK